MNLEERIAELNKKHEGWIPFVYKKDESKYPFEFGELRSGRFVVQINKSGFVNFIVLDENGDVYSVFSTSSEWLHEVADVVGELKEENEKETNERIKKAYHEENH